MRTCRGCWSQTGTSTLPGGSASCCCWPQPRPRPQLRLSYAGLTSGSGRQTIQGSEAGGRIKSEATFLSHEYSKYYLSSTNYWPASCEKGPSDICKKCRPRPAAASLTPRLHFLTIITSMALIFLAM